MNGFFQNIGFTSPMQNQINFQQQFYNLYFQYCMMNGLNAQDQTNYNKYCQIWMMMMMNNNPTNIPINGGGTHSPDPSNLYIKDENNPKEIIPREKPLYMKPDELTGSSIQPQMSNQNLNPFQPFTGISNDIINITLVTTTGLKVVIPAPKIITFEDLFINYANKAGIPISTIWEKIIFLYNTEKLDVKSKQPISSLLKGLNAVITVLEQ